MSAAAIASSPLNSIAVLTGLAPHDLLAKLIRNEKKFPEIMEALLANLSQKSPYELLKLVEDSSFVSNLEMLEQLILSGMIDDDVFDLKDHLERTFCDPMQGQENLFAVLALVQLLTSSSDCEIDNQVERLKGVFKLIFSHSAIAIHLMNMRDRLQEGVELCDCQRCNAMYILSIGWYVVVQQQVHATKLFVICDG